MNLENSFKIFQHLDNISTSYVLWIKLKTSCVNAQENILYKLQKIFKF